VAVVGASQDPGKMGYMTLNSIIQGGYEGNIYPINPKADHVLGLRAYPSISHVPGPIDLIVVVIPAPYVAAVLREAVEK
ncbi:MAG: CoA-binding protein, partial [Deltaproteobacteria bacterium]|nr:CoA-binding protein [Deltaproteobacteria bacterium]